MKNKIIIVLVLLLICSGLFFVFKIRVSQSTQPSLSQARGLGDVPNEKTEKLSDGWFLYTNTRARISFEFPNGFKLEPEGYYAWLNDIPSTIISNRANGKERLSSYIQMPTQPQTNKLDETLNKTSDEWKEQMISISEKQAFLFIDGTNIEKNLHSDPGSGEVYTEVFYYQEHKNTGSFYIHGFSASTTDRIIKSLNFF